jgi:integrase
MQHLTIAEIKRLVRCVSPEHRLMILVTFWHGLRVSEAINLRGRDIQDGHVHVRRLKGSLETIQPYVIHEDPVLDESYRLAELAKSVPYTVRLFPITRFGYYKLMRRAGEMAGIPEYKKVRPHILKHSIIMQTIKQGGIENVRQWAGHKNIASTGHYCRVSDQDAYRALFGGAG